MAALISEKAQAMTAGGLAINTKPASSSRLLSGLDSVFGIWPFALALVAMVAFCSVLPLRMASSGNAELAPSGISVISTTVGLSETAMPTSQSFGYDWNNVTIQTEISLLLQL